MKYELLSISPGRLARIMALVLGGIFLLFCLIALPMFILMPFPEDDPDQPPKAFFLVFLVLYPLFGALWGWVAGQISARLYNAAARRIGGVSLDLTPIEGEKVAPPKTSLEPTVMVQWFARRAREIHLARPARCWLHRAAAQLNR